MSVNIKTDYGALGDGQIVTDTCTITSGAPTTLITGSSHWTSGDIGKFIAIGGASTDPNVNLTHLTTISAVPAGNQVTLSAAATAFLSAQSEILEWGTNDTGAFNAFNIANAGLSNVTLIIPAGRYCMASGVGTGQQIGLGVKSVAVNGTGGPTLTDMNGAGSGYNPNSNGRFLYNDNTAQSLVQTVSAGSTVLTMVTTADAAKHTANTWGWLTGYDTQGFGNPPNPAWSEFVFITAVDTVAGTVTIQTPLIYSYKSTWPAWVLGSPGSGPPNYTGGAFGLGGPATLYLIQPTWDAEQIWDGVNFNSNYTLFNCTARSITIKNSVCENFGPNVSVQKDFVADNLTVPTLWELDKGTQNCTISNSTVRGFVVQSRSPFNVTLNNVTCSVFFNGAPTNYTVNNCSIPDSPLLSPTAYANSETISISNSTFNGTGTFGATGVGEGDIAGAGAWSVSNGLMSRAIAAGTGEPPQWAIPGSYFTFGARYEAEDPVWKCIDIYESGGNLFLQTDQTVSSFPAGVNGASVGIHCVLPKVIGYSGNTGTNASTGWVPPRFGAHWLKTYSGNIGISTLANLIKVWGQVISIKITVGAGYSGGTLNLDGPFVVNKPQNTDVIWSPVIDLTVAGTRIITPSGVTGGGGSDSGLTLPNSGNVWLVSNQITPAMSGATGAGSVTIEIQTDQGFQDTPPPSQQVLFRPSIRL
jgi:hypothetical protein